MSLAKYKEKRSFDKTPEPTGGAPTNKKLQFVIQKHHASHLHYDFRLELRGILKSWAIPKGPSMDPEEKRLAMLVEDHPWDYKDFEGIIPSGYGAGTVMVWDQGTYETTATDDKNKKAQEHSITSQFWKGQISITLHGHKVKGTFKLTRSNDKEKNAWYLVKEKDKYASKNDITGKDKSVLSHKTLEQVKENPAKTWQSNRPGKEEESVEATSHEVEQVNNEDISTLLKKGIKSTFPANIDPMLCSLIKEPFDDPDFLYEVKWDGYRLIAYVQKGKVALSSRSGLDYTAKYKPVVEELKKTGFDVVLDGEVIALDKSGHPDFDALQKNSGGSPLAFYVFDILWYKGYNLMQLRLVERKQILSQVIPFNEVIKYSDHFDEGIKLFDVVKEQGMEGIVAKRKDSRYEPGRRGKNWLKLPTERRQEFVIGGWTESDSGSLFASLLFGYYEKGKLLFQGQAGGGFKEKNKREIFDKLKKLEIPGKPFSNKVDTDRKSHWVKPELVANIKFATYTSSGKIRKPAIFLGLRYDKKPETVVSEKVIKPGK